jgi:alcohol dehydrogenase YqhD (iron-dependent ADH family)
MAIDKVKEYFKPLHMEDHILEFDVSSATVELAAEALHCEGMQKQCLSWLENNLF